MVGLLRSGEQPALNYALRRTAGLSYRILPRELYPNGATHFMRGIRPPGSVGPMIVHNNWMRGAEGKRARFEQHGMWFLDDGASDGGGGGGVRRQSCRAHTVQDSPNTAVEVQ